MERAMDIKKRSYLTVAEAADALAVSRKTIYRLVWRGELPARRVGRTVRIPAGAISDGICAGDGARHAAATVLRSGPGSRSGIGED
jgi:excisionase family DNA binding protein